MQFHCPKDCLIFAENRVVRMEDAWAVCLRPLFSPWMSFVVVLLFEPEQMVFQSGTCQNSHFCAEAKHTECNDPPVQDEDQSNKFWWPCLLSNFIFVFILKPIKFIVSQIKRCFAFSSVHWGQSPVSRSFLNHTSCPAFRTCSWAGLVQCLIHSLHTTLRNESLAQGIDPQSPHLKNWLIVSANIRFTMHDSLQWLLSVSSQHATFQFQRQFCVCNKHCQRWQHSWCS